MAAVTFLMMLFMGGFCGLCGAIRYFKKLKEYKLDIAGINRALKQKETPETLREFDLKAEIMFERLDKELAEMRSHPGFDPRKIELHQMKIAAKRKELPEHRKFILDAIAGHHGKTPPNPISIAVWAGAGAFAAFVFGVFIASAAA